MDVLGKGGLGELGYYKCNSKLVFKQKWGIRCRKRKREVRERGWRGGSRKR